MQMTPGIWNRWLKVLGGASHILKEHIHTCTSLSLRSFHSLLCMLQVWRGTFRPSSMGSTWLSLWSWKPFRVLSTTQSPTSHSPSPSTDGLARARTSWPGSSLITYIATGWRASVSACSSPPSTSHMPDWWTRTRYDTQNLVGTESAVLCQEHVRRVLGAPPLV